MPRPAKRKPLKDNFVTITLSRMEVGWLHALLHKDEIKGLVKTVSPRSEEIYADRIINLISFAPTDESSNIKVDFNRRCVIFNNKIARFTKLEMEVLHVLFHNFGSYIAKEEISALVSTSFDQRKENFIKMTISRIRKRLTQIGAEHIIHTQSKQGWMIRY